MQVSKCLGHLLLRVMLFWSYKGIDQISLSLISSTESLLSSTISFSWQDHTPSSWTFVGAGYLAVYPTVFSNQNQDYKLSFRTRHSNGYLFCHILKNNKQNHLQLKNYKFCVELHKGSLKVTYSLNANTDTVVMGKALHNDKWHAVEVQLVTSSGDLIVTLDGISQSQPLTAYSSTNPATVLNWNMLSSVILYGGTDTVHSHFIGCLKNLQLLNSSGTYSNIEAPLVTGSVETGCRDRCQTDDPCHGGTKCINYYTHVKCDCFGTDLQGQYCDQTGSTKVTLQGYEWLTYQLYDKPEDRTFSDKSRFSLQFKSDRASGVLIYAVGDQPYYNHVIASVHEGKVTASVGFEHQVTLEVELGSGIDDYRQAEGWHNLTIIHNKNTVTFILDDEIKVKNTNSDSYYLSLDPKIFFGGGNNFVITKGLQVTQNFLGCLKNVYVNDVSLVYEMKHDNPRVIHSGGAKPQYGCHKVENIPISFPKSGTMIELDIPSPTNLSIEFGFRTVRDRAVVFYTDILSLESYEIGYFEIWIKDHQVILHLVPSMGNPDKCTDITIDRVVNNNQWHMLHLHFTERTTYIKIDHLSKIMNHTSQLELSGQLKIGYGRKAYDVNEGFVGCIRNLKINDKDIDPVSLMQRHLSVYGVKLDGCNLVPHCEGGPHCEHEGKCLSDWDGVTCDCSNTAYEGHACHFPKYRQTCDSYYQAGYKQTGAYQIDLDGSGPLKPVYVRCVMDYQYKGETYGMAHVDHNLISNTQIRGVGLYDMRLILSYRELSREVLVKLTEASTWCEQFVEYNCYSAPLKLGKSTIFSSASGKIVELHYNTDDDSLCSCRKGTCPENRCKCDQGFAQWEKDSGYIRYKQHLPITEIRIIQSKSSSQQTNANLSLGSLNCWGDVTSRVETSVTFLTTSSYLRLRPWTSTSLHFMFRTFEKKALLLNQTQSLDNSNSLIILLADDSIRFMIQVNNETIEVSLRSDRMLPDGERHYVAMEMDKHNIRCTVDKKSQLLKMPGNQIPLFKGELYIGGYKNEDVISGLKGCMRGFSYNDQVEELSRLTDPSNSEVKVGCQASCESNPCENGAKCVEHWGSYNCICTNPWAHWGDSCEINVNTDEVSFDGEIQSFLDLDGFKEDNLLDSTIILSFRTRKNQGLLLYIHDALNNFLQLELEKGDRLRLAYNHYKTCVFGYLDVADLNDGKWKQIVIHELKNGNNLQTKMFVDSPENYVIIPYTRLKLTTYSKDPYSDMSCRSLIKPPRSEGTSNTLMNEYYRLFVGGAPVNTSDQDQIMGCIRGLKIGNKVFSLQQEALQHFQQDSDHRGIATRCSEGCSPNPCQHKGVCTERWGDNQFHCDCDKTNYSGKRCHIEATGNFTGNSVLEYKFNLIRDARHTASEKLTLTFQTSGSIGGKQVILAVVMSSKHPDHDLLLFVLNEEGVRVEHYQQRITQGLLKLGKYADGKPHKLQYWRYRDEMFLTLDDESVAKAAITTKPLDELDKMMLGGVIEALLPNYIEKTNEYINFTGCISEVIFTPVAEIGAYVLKPMKELRNFVNDTFTVHGDQIAGCTLDDEPEESTVVPTSVTVTKISEERTMPPWNPGPAETICSGCPPPTSTVTVVVTTSSTEQTVQTISMTPSTATVTDRLNMTRVPLGQDTTGGATELEIVVALGIVLGLMLISIMIALILCKKRKRERYVVKKLPPDDLELKVPLNHTSSPPPSQKPYDHIARLDEFSMVSVTLGPAKRRKENGIAPPGSEPLLSDDHSPGDYPVQSTFYNKKKNRPASSISEVLEEIERQRREKEVDENPQQEEGSKQEPGDLEWDPVGDRQPLTSKPEDVESEADPLQVLEQQKDLTLEGNGDSGYEAESRKDGDEDIINITPPSPDKMYMYDISGHSGPHWGSMPSQKLYVESGT